MAQNEQSRIQNEQLEVQNQQLIAQNKQSMFDSLTRLHHELIGIETQKALRLIYSYCDDPNRLVRDTEPGSLAISYENLHSIELLLNSYDLIGFRVKQEVIPKDAVLETESMILLRIWKCVENFINAERDRRNDPKYKKPLECLVKEAEKHRKQKAEDVMVFIRG